MPSECLDLLRDTGGMPGESGESALLAHTLTGAEWSRKLQCEKLEECRASRVCVEWIGGRSKVRRRMRRKARRK